MFGFDHSCGFEILLLRIRRSDCSKCDRSCGSMGATIKNVTVPADPWEQAFKM